MKSAYLIGVDLGATNTRVAIVDENGHILKKKQVLTEATRGFEAVIATISELALDLQTELDIKASVLGIGVPGQVSTKEGIVYFAPNLNWLDLDLGKKLYSLLNIPCILTNDVRAAAYGEWKKGAGENCTDLVTVFVGTGVGGGIIINNRLLNGFGNCAGEIGHMTIDLNGPICSCGNMGCLEALTSGWAIAKKANKQTAKEVIEDYHNKDPVANAIIQDCFHALSVGCLNLVRIFNPQRLILGGGIIEHLPEALIHVENKIFSQTSNSATNILDVLPAKLEKDAGLIGSALFAKDYITR